MVVRRVKPRRAERVGSKPGRAQRTGIGRVNLTFSSAFQVEWAATISQQEWEIYRGSMEALRAAGIPYMLGGGFALAAFTGRWRDTKDIDFYIRPTDRDAAVAALTRAGFVDLYNKLPYDRKWIYRSLKSGVIVDIIWSMANQRAQVDDAWFERAGLVSLRNQQLKVVPREEFIWCKLYIMQRDHCDWTDIFNLLYLNATQIDWDHVIQRLEDDIALLKAMLTAYSWLCPKEAADLPAGLWRRLGLRAPKPPREPPARDRIRLLDSRCWFAGRKCPGDKLEV